MNNVNYLRKQLYASIDELISNQSAYLKENRNHFSRNRKLPLKTLIESILFMGANAIKDELNDLFLFEGTPSTSAFVQQRQKIKADAFEFLFKTFNKKIQTTKGCLFKGYKLLAIDGSTIPISHNPNDPDTHMKLSRKNGEPCKGYNAFHITAAYDLLSHIYTDVVLQGEAHMDENSAFNEMVDRYDAIQKAIFIADRGFESINSFVHVMKTQNKFLVRVKDINSRTSVCKSFNLPKEGEFDIDVSKILTRKQTNYIKSNPDIYKFMPKNQRFDFFDNEFFEFQCRVVRFKITENTYETIFTNLDREQFTPKAIKELYNMRWGIETSFRELKYAVGLCAFHAKNRESIKQEIYAKMIFYNFSEKIIRNVKPKKTNKKRMYIYAINSTRAFHIIRIFLKKKSGGQRPPNIVSIIANEIEPIRPGRSDPRKIRVQAPVNFFYRYQ